MNESQEWLLLTAGTPPTFNPGYIPGNRGFGALTAADVSFATAGLSRLPTAFAYATFLGSMDELLYLEQHVHRRLVRTAGRECWRINKGQRHAIERMAALAVYEAISARSNRDFYAHDEKRPSRGDASVKCPDCCGKGHYVREGLNVRLFLRYRARVRFAYQHWAAQPASPLRTQNLKRVRLLRWKAEELLTEADADSDTKWKCELCRGSGVFTLSAEWRAKICHIGKTQWHCVWKSRFAPVLEHVQQQEEIAIRHVRRRLRRND